MRRATSGNSKSVRSCMGVLDGANAADEVVRHGCAERAQPPPRLSVEAKGGGGGGPSLRRRERAAVGAYGTGALTPPADCLVTAVWV